MPNSRYPVVITAADHPTGLITARSLMGTEAHLIGLYRNRDLPACRSKMWTELHQLGDTKEAVEANLIRIGKRFDQKPVLFPIQDGMVQWLSRNRARLSNFFLFTLPPEQTVEIMLDKAAFHKWAEGNGFQVPESRILSDNNELYGYLIELGFKAIVKPYLKTERWEQANPRDKVFKLNCKSDYEQLPSSIFSDSPKLVVQKWIPGGDDRVYFCLTYFDRQLNDVACFTGMKIHQWPVDCGSTAMAVSVANSEIEETTKTLFRRLNFKGLGSVEFKMNPTDGKFYIIEPTVGRNDLQSYVSVPKGLNFTRFAFEELVEQNIRRARPRSVQTLWINEETVLDSFRESPERMPILLNRMLKRILLNITSFAYFHPKDPAPFLWLILKKFSGKLKRLFGRRRISFQHE